MDDDSMDRVQKGVLVRIRAHFNSLSSSEKQVSEYVSAHPEKVIQMSLAELAKRTNVSDATALRFARTLGFSGYNEMKLALVADTVEPVDAIFDDVRDDDNIATIAQKAFRFNIKLIEDTLNTLDWEAINRAVEALSTGERILIYAIGSSLPLGDYFYNRLLRLGYNVMLITDPYYQLTQAALLSADDVVLAISRSGNARPINKAFEAASQQGAKTIAITCNSESLIASAAAINITAVTREIRTEVLASSVAVVTLLDAIYAALVLKNKAKTVENQRKIYETLMVMRGIK